MRTHKYGAKAIYISGQRFASTGEGERYLFLRTMALEGRIHDLRTQVPFVLFPPVYEQKTLTRGPRKGQTANGRLLREGITYVADFVYTLKDGTRVVEDFKGFETPVFKIKRRLMFERFGIDVLTVRRPCEPVGQNSPKG